MLDLQAYLVAAIGRRQVAVGRFAARVEIGFEDSSTRDAEVRFTLPEEATSPIVAGQCDARGRRHVDGVALRYRLRAASTKRSSRRPTIRSKRDAIAMNVDPEEGDLAALDGKQLAPQSGRRQVSVRAGVAVPVGGQRSGRLQPRRGHSVRAGLAVDRRADLGMVGQLPSARRDAAQAEGGAA